MTSAGFQLFNLLMDGVAHLGRRVAGKRDGIKGEEARVLVAGEGAETLGLGGDLLLLDQAAIEARDAAVRHDVADGVVDRIVGIAIVGPMIALNIEGLRLVANDDGLLSKLLRLDGGHLFRLGAAGNAAEVFFQHGHRGLGVHVAHDGDHDVAADVVLLVERHGLGGVDLAYFAGPADGAAAVVVGHVGRGQELLDEAADGIGVGAHAPLLYHHVALFVEFAGHGIGQTARLHPCP